MKLNKILMTAALLAAGVCANAQETVTEYVFKPHWYGQLQIGFQETLGDGDFGKLMSPNAQLAVGYKFNPLIGMRLAINAWQSKGVAKMFTNNDQYSGYDKYYKWNYVAPTVDAVLDLTNLFGGYNPTRLVQVDLIAGVGANIGFSNKEALDFNKEFLANNSNWDVAKDGQPLQLAWDGTKARFVGQFGFDVNFNLSERCQLGLEMMANVLPDGYNSKKAKNADWYFNCLLGVSYAFGPKYETVTRVIEEPVVEPQIIERIVEKIVEVPVEVAPPAPEMFRRDVFFKINKYEISTEEMKKVAQVAEYMNQHPNTNVTITGYADKGTGTMAFNLRLSAQRAEAVAKVLQNTYGIPASRMTVKSMGEAEDQPYPDPVQNRVAICIAE